MADMTHLQQAAGDQGTGKKGGDRGVQNKVGGIQGRAGEQDCSVGWLLQIHIAWTNLEVSQLRQCRVSAPQLGESIQEGLPLFHGIK